MSDGAAAKIESRLDVEKARVKYRQERDKRTHVRGEGQYIETDGDYAHFYFDDPYAPPQARRAPITRDTTVTIIGGGWGGLLSAGRLREAGIDDIQIIDTASDFGGTWYWNRYPGAQCDVESYCYLPLLEETGYVPTEKFAYAPEIFEHAKRIGKTFDLYRHALFGTAVTELRWVEAKKRWVISTNHGDSLTSRFVIVAVGTVNRGKLPGIPGIKEFQGHAFHTSRWDYAYTGGSHSEKLAKLSDKRVAIIGTGATAVQCVPALAASAKQLYVFQRTPSTVGYRLNTKTDQRWVEGLKPGWQRERQANFDDIFVKGASAEFDLVQDGLSEIFKALRPIGSSPDEMARLSELGDLEILNKLRERIDSVVKDPKTAEALKPWYGIMCKRPCFNDEYLTAFNRPNVELIDTSANKGIDRITRNGIVANGVEYAVDCIIYGTGFEQRSDIKRRIGFDIYGRDGQSLYDHWARGMRTVDGYCTHGFPNWFYVGAGQHGASFNYTSIAEPQCQQLAYVISQAVARGAETVEPTAEAEAQYVSTVRPETGKNTKYLEDCTPGYYNSEGELHERPARFDLFEPGANEMRRMQAAWRNAGRMEGFKLE